MTYISWTEIQTLAILITAIAALITIWYNGNIAKKRATIDLVLHQRSDGKLTRSRNKIRELSDLNQSLSQYACEGHIGSNETKAILEVLNHYEFIAAGIAEKAFHEPIYKRMQYGVLVRDWNQTKAFIFELRKVRSHHTLFQEFQCLGEKWVEKPLKKSVK